MTFTSQFIISGHGLSFILFSPSSHIFKTSIESSSPFQRVFVYIFSNISLPLPTPQVDFPPAMGGKSSELLYDMRVRRAVQPRFDNASASGLWLEVVNTDKDSLKYTVR
jgi:hypothetical protein